MKRKPVTPEQIRELMAAMGVTTQAEFAYALNTDFSTVNKWLNGVRKPGKMACGIMRNLAHSKGLNWE